MDFATILGLLVSFGLISTALFLGGEASIFLNLPSFLIVMGGTLGATLTNYPWRVVFNAGIIISRTLIGSKKNLQDVARQCLDFSVRARRDGLLSLETMLNEIDDDPYMRKSLQLAIDGLEPETIMQVMTTEIDNTEIRHDIGIELLNSMAAYAPALGLIGTVIGLVQMLSNMEDPSTIGSAMAVALITTFYGAILANLVFLPIAGKLKHRSMAEIQIMELQMAGIMGIAKGENPRVLKEILEGFQAPIDRPENILKQMM